MSCEALTQPLRGRPRWAMVAFTLTAVAAVAAVPSVAVAPLAGASTVGMSSLASGPDQGAEVAGGIGLRVVDVPATSEDDPRARLYIVDHRAPDSVSHRRVEVSNDTDAETHVALYAAGATIEDGAFVGAEGHTANDMSTWVSVQPSGVDLAAGERVTADVTMTIPSDAAPGEHYGVVWAEVRSAPSAGGGVTQVSRVGIRLYLSVGPGGAPAADFTIDSLTATREANGSPTVLATVHNTGGRALDMSGTLELLAGPGGLRAGPFPASLGTTLAIGATESVRIVLDERLPAGPWDAWITLRSGLVERDARATITFPATGVAPPVRTTSPRRDQWYLVIAGLALLMIVINGWLLARRARQRRSRIS